MSLNISKKTTPTAQPTSTVRKIKERYIVAEDLWCKKGNQIVKCVKCVTTLNNIRWGTSIRLI